jgi:Na+/H+ antiporter
MGAIELVLVMLAAVVVSGVVVRVLPVAIPTPLVQIGLGALIAIFTDDAVRLDPDLFFLLFLPPLLFLDGWRIPKEGLLHDHRMILALALGLVFITVLGMGWFIHWLIPAMPMPVAFALAAILSPTDPVAVSAITKRIPVPPRLQHILEGESLLNDASGLVCFRFAVAAALTGVFSLADASLTFLWLFVGGVAIGVGITWAVMQLKGRLNVRFGEESGSQVLISLLLPFLSYIGAEHLHCSGILAAVAAGITMSYMEMTGKARGSTRTQRTAVWDTVQFALNGVMFVLLGEQLPGIFDRAVMVVQETQHDNPLWLAVYVLVINFGLAVMRFLWVWCSLRIDTVIGRWRGEPAQARAQPSFRIVAAMSVAGVRGAITLAGVLTLPLLLADGSPFPARDLAIFLAAGVIVMSLLASNFFLPHLLRGLHMPGHGEDPEVDRARVKAAEAAIAAVQQQVATHDPAAADADLYAEVAARVLESYERRIHGHQQDDESAQRFRRGEAYEREIRLAALRAERDTIFALARANQLSDADTRRLVREIDLLEERFG